MSKKSDIAFDDSKKLFNETEQQADLVEQEPPVPEEPVVKDDVQDIDLSAIRKKKFRIDGDNSRILELNVSDMGIISRLKDTYPKLTKLAGEAMDINMSDNDEETMDEAFSDSGSIGKMADALKSIDTKMREYVDYIFDSNVSEVCVSSGSMFDPFMGKLRFEHLIDVLSGLYETNMTEEFKKLSKRVQKHTDKYTKAKR